MRKWKLGGLRSTLAVTLAVFAALIPVAWLQYRWIGRVSEVEHERMRAHLLSATQGFMEQILQRTASLRFGIPEGEQDLPAAEAWSLRREVNDAGIRLARQLYASRGGRHGVDEILRWDEGTGRFELISWPRSFESLRARMANGHSDSVADGDLPAIAFPRFDMSPAGTVTITPRERILTGWTIFELDLESLRKGVFPQLVRIHFPRPAGLDYQVRVVSTAPSERVIFSTDPSLPAAFFATPDMEGPLPSLGWAVQVKNRSGSLEAVVAQTRRRNLAISLFVLALLGASVSLLLVTVRRAQQLAQAQMEFVAAASHELRSPLAVICSAADNLADGVVANEQQIRRYGFAIAAEGRRLGRMAEQILSFAGIQSGRAKYEFEPAEISGVLAKALAACEQEIRNSGCEVETRIEPDLPPVEADPVSLMHCVRNLIDNALTHGKRSGRICIRAARAAHEKGLWVEIEVEDDGAGIEPGDLPRVFEPFYRGRRAVEGQARGFGLGLALVKRIVEAHSGTIEVASAPGRGACFSMRLPAIDAGGRDSGTQNPAD